MIKRKLEELGFSDLEIVNCYVIELGCMFFKSKKEESISNENIKNLNLEVLKKVLEKHPNIFSIDTFKYREEEITTYDRHSFFNLTKYLNIKIKLPIHVSKLGILGEHIENFKVIMNGSMYAAFAEINQIPMFCHIGAEYREIISKQLENDESEFKYLMIGPNPIHPNIYLLFYKDNNFNTTILTDKEKRDIYIIMPQTDINNYICSLILCEHTALSGFYNVKNQIYKLNEFLYTIRNLYNNLSLTFSNMISNSFWKFWAKISYSKQIRNLLLQINKVICDFESSQIHFNNNKMEVLDRINKDDILRLTIEYFKNELNYSDNISANLPKSLDFFCNEMQTIRNIYSIVVTSIVGLVGVIIGAIITAYFK
jgi:hypothetical protein